MKIFHITKNLKQKDQLNTGESVKKKLDVAKKIDNRQLFVTKKIETQITGDAYAGEETVKYLVILKKLNNDNAFIICIPAHC